VTIEDLVDELRDRLPRSAVAISTRTSPTRSGHPGRRRPQGAGRASAGLPPRSRQGNGATCRRVAQNTHPGASTSSCPTPWPLRAHGCRVLADGRTARPQGDVSGRPVPDASIETRWASSVGLQDPVPRLGPYIAWPGRRSLAVTRAGYPGGYRSWLSVVLGGNPEQSGGLALVGYWRFRWSVACGFWFKSPLGHAERGRSRASARCRPRAVLLAPPVAGHHGCRRPPAVRGGVHGEGTGVARSEG
jgi:hypothetical protein